MKYGIRDYRGGGRASGRETVARVAAGAIAKKILATHDIQILGHVVEIGGIAAKEVGIEELKTDVDKNAVRCADSEAAGKMEALIKQVKAAGDSVGGIVEVIAFGVPTGLGEPVFDKLDAELAKAFLLTPDNSHLIPPRHPGSNNPEGRISTRTNNAGGILGGISTGAPVVCRIAVKPTASISKPQRSVDMAKMEEVELKIEGRHDPCICPRIVPVAEAMVALVLVDCWMRMRNESI
jgi:chorismate synthase